MNIVNSQERFYQIFDSVNRIYTRNLRSMYPAKGKLTDSAAYIRSTENRLAVMDTLYSVSEGIIGSTLPDITYTTDKAVIRSLSESDSLPLILYYLHPFCGSCFQLIDTTLTRIYNNANILLLLDEAYRNNLKDLPHLEKVSAGTINRSTASMLSLRQGSNVIYYLSRGRKIEFFRQLIFAEGWEDWLKFLDETKFHGSH